MSAASLVCPACGSTNVKVDYRIAVKDEDSYHYPATCECGAAIGLDVDPKDLRKMIPVGRKT